MTLVLAATPIGEPDDASTRLAAVLATADIIAAEDTRRLRRLFQHLKIAPAAKVVSYHEHNEAARTAGLLADLHAGARVVLVSDAGTPAVSDPGYRLVRAAIQADLPVTCVPGPSAVLMALAVSGLAVDRFCFEGFLARKAGERSQQLQALMDEKRTMVFFEAPHRLAATLQAMCETFGAERPAAVCRELTKTHEEVIRGPIRDLVQWAQQGVRGEITLVVAGCRPPVLDLATATAQVLALAAAGERLSAASARVAAATGLPRQQLYDGAVTARAHP